MEKKHNTNVKNVNENNYYRTIKKPESVPKNTSSSIPNIVNLSQQFSFKENIACVPTEIIKINLNPTRHAHTSYEISDLKNNWFMNLSNTNIPRKIQSLLQLGEGFNLPSSNIKTTTIEFVKHINNNINRLKIFNKIELRNRLFPCDIKKTLAKQMLILMSRHLSATKTFINIIISMYSLHMLIKVIALSH